MIIKCRCGERSKRKSRRGRNAEFDGEEVFRVSWKKIKCIMTKLDG